MDEWRTVWNIQGLTQYYENGFVQPQRPSLVATASHGPLPFLLGYALLASVLDSWRHVRHNHGLLSPAIQDCFLQQHNKYDTVRHLLRRNILKDILWLLPWHSIPLYLCFGRLANRPSNGLLPSRSYHLWHTNHTHYCWYLHIPS